MVYSIFGQVITVRKFTNGDIEVDFYHDDEITTYRYSSDPNRLGNFPKELTETLISTLSTNTCIEIFFEDNGNPTYIELEECEDDLDDDEFDENSEE
ncbi:MAG: hypothetical protein ACRBBZ_04890 [Nitrosopumilus sp.]